MGIKSSEVEGSELRAFCQLEDLLATRQSKMESQFYYFTSEEIEVYNRRD